MIRLEEYKRKRRFDRTPERESAMTQPHRYGDRVLLVLAALLVCVFGTGAFWLADIYHVNPVWVFFAWSSIGILTLFIDDFRTHLKKPSFVAFLVAWAVIHGLLVAALMRWLSIPTMLPLLAIELTAGYFLADLMFDIRPTKEERD